MCSGCKVIIRCNGIEFNVTLSERQNSNPGKILTLAVNVDGGGWRPMLQAALRVTNTVILSATTGLWTCRIDPIKSNVVEHLGEKTWEGDGNKGKGRGQRPSDGMIRCRFSPFHTRNFLRRWKVRKILWRVIRIEILTCEISMVHLLAPDLTADRMPNSRCLQFPGLPERQYSNQSGDVLGWCIS